MMYIFEHPKTCTIAWYTLFMDLVTSHGLQTPKMLDFDKLFAIFGKFNFTSNEGHICSSQETLHGVQLNGLSE